MRKIVLASQSPRRVALLKQIGLTPRIAPSYIEEKMNPRLKPKSQAEYLSLQKAQAVAPRYKDAIIIAADTLVIVDNQILGKPTSANDAKRMLKKLSGQAHTVITGFTILDTKTTTSLTDSCETTVVMKQITDKEITAYVTTKEPLDKAGSYGINEKGALLVERIEGDFANVVGLPLQKLSEALKKFGINVL